MLTALEQAMQLKKWENRSLPVRGVDNKVISSFLLLVMLKRMIRVLKSMHYKQGRSFRSGIVGIERSLEQKHRDADDSISRAFQGLSQLIDMARDMVTLSRNISIKIKVQSN